MRFSVVIPAHNEEALLPRGLAAVHAAAARVEGGVEIVVVDNRCTDATAALAKAAGAVVVRSEARNIAAVRNLGVATSTGEFVVTVDADSVMPPTALAEIDQLLSSGRYVGGGTRFIPERRSLGIWASTALVRVMTRLSRLSGAMFWFRRSDFVAVGGFNEELLIAEDLDFAHRLRTHGRVTGRKFTCLTRAPLVISTRKFDRFGDWHMFGMALQMRQIRAAWRGTDSSWADRYFFDYND